MVEPSTSGTRVSEPTTSAQTMSAVVLAASSGLVFLHLAIAGWPDLNTLSARLVIATAALFGFLSAVAAQLFHQQREPVPLASSAPRGLRIQG